MRKHWRHFTIQGIKFKFLNLQRHYNKYHGQSKRYNWQHVSCIVCFGRDIYYKAIQHFRFSCYNVIFIEDFNYSGSTPSKDSIHRKRTRRSEISKSCLTLTFLVQCHNRKSTLVKATRPREISIFCPLAIFAFFRFHKLVQTNFEQVEMKACWCSMIQTCPRKIIK